MAVPGGCCLQGCHGYPTCSALLCLVALPSSGTIPMPASIVDGFNKKFSSYQVLQ